jgi:hypothetical protein
MDEFDFLQQYTDAAKDSTNRTRQILLVMIVASILMFAAFWNSRTGGWANSRLALAKATQDILANEDDRKRHPEIWGELKVTPGDEELYRKAKEYIDKAPSRTLQQAKDSLFWSQKIRTEQVGQIQVPVLGINFDVNDLGMLGGFTFIVLLIWVNYSLWHQSNNFRLAFDFARELGARESNKEGTNRLLYHTYQNLAMHQVLTIPPRPASARSSRPDKPKAWIRKVSKLLYALPLAVQTTVVAHDWYTTDIGELISLDSTNTVLITGTAFWCLIAILTVMCFRMWRKTHDTWKSVADTI